MIQIIALLTTFQLRFDSAPEAGDSRGLDLILDAHTDLITASSVTKPFQVIISKYMYIQNIHLPLSISLHFNRVLMQLLTPRWNTLWSP